mmetsp:Transcript_3225/g.3849  ORF Transcript_3225/g.3849 Transcript_3225/m.3849 type:complete len:138 (-) Transcript_3225:29-442(-)
MKLDRNQHFLESSSRIRDWFRLWRHEKQPGYIDNHKAIDQKFSFKHSGALLSKMADLRYWTIYYAPHYANPLRRLQEVHKIDSEFSYIQYRIIWRRVLPLVIAITFFTRVVFKKRLLNKGEDDAYEMTWRDVYILNK